MFNVLGEGYKSTVATVRGPYLACDYSSAAAMCISWDVAIIIIIYIRLNNYVAS